MVKSTGIKGGPIVLKKILLMSCALLALVGATVVHAAPRITKVAYGVSPDRQLRVVLETTTPARMRSEFIEKELQVTVCLLYTSDAADDTPCVDLGGRRIIKKIFF